MAKCDTASGQVDIWSDLQVRLTLGQADFGQMCDTTLGQLVRSSGQVDIWSDVPSAQRHLVANCDTTSGQIDIWSDLQVRLIFGQMYPQAETSCGQV